MQISPPRHQVDAAPGATRAAALEQRPGGLTAIDRDTVAGGGAIVLGPGHADVTRHRAAAR